MTTQPPQQSKQSNDSLLLALATGLAQADSQDAMFQLVAAYTRANIVAERASICLLDGYAGQTFSVVSLAGTAVTIPHGTTFPLQDSLINKVVSARQPRIWRLSEQTELDARALLENGVVAAFNTPILCADQVYGTINIGYLDYPDESDSPSHELLTSLAELLGSQLARIKANEQLEREVASNKRHIGKLERLHELETELARATNLDGVIRTLSKTVADLIGAKRVSFAKLGPNPGESTVFGIHGMKGLAAGTVIATGDHTSTETKQTKDLPKAELDEVRLRYTPDHRTSDNPIHQKLLASGVMSSMNLGIFVHEQVIGTLNVGSASVDGISAADQALALALASFMSSTMQRLDTQAELMFAAHHDHLTGLVRRTLFDSYLDLAIQVAVAEQRTVEQGPIAALCFIDVDRFKLVNDLEGHVAGDELLRDIGARIERSIGSAGTPSRLGADEFIALLHPDTAANHQAICREVTAAIADVPFISNGRAFSSSVSIGLSFLTELSASGAEALASAEAACHTSKLLGGNRVSIESMDDESQAVRRTAASWITRIKEALRYDEFVLYAQPIRPLSDQGTASVEVLIRLAGPNGSIIPPDRFIPIAEQYGLIGNIDTWVATNALDAMRKAMDQQDAGGPDAPECMFINLSVNSISSEGFFEELLEVVDQSRVPTNRIVFEITETGTMHNFELALEFVNRMRVLGPRFALDDFGVGLSSLGYLRRLGVDFLKIDGSLVKDIGRDPIKSTMVAAIKSMADALDIRTIAEHIETDEDLAVLRTIGVDNVQGYFVGHPAPIERTLQLAPVEANVVVPLNQPTSAHVAAPLRAT